MGCQPVAAMKLKHMLATLALVLCRSELGDPCIVHAFSPPVLPILRCMGVRSSRYCCTEAPPATKRTWGRRLRVTLLAHTPDANDDKALGLIRSRLNQLHGEVLCARVGTQCVKAFG